MAQRECVAERVSVGGPRGHRLGECTAAYGGRGSDDRSRHRFAVQPRPPVYAGAMFPPERIVCLTEETVETLYLLGEDRRIVGVSGYAVRPPQVRKEKPRGAAVLHGGAAKKPAL